MNASSQQERERYAKEHVRSVASHVEEMSAKDYNSYLPKEKRLVDFNIMFMPVEAAFQLMMTVDPLLWQNARSKGVLIVSQMNLLVFLQMFVQLYRIRFHGNIVAKPHQYQRQLQKSQQEEDSPQRDSLKPAKKPCTESEYYIRSCRPYRRAKGRIFIFRENGCL